MHERRRRAPWGWVEASEVEAGRYVQRGIDRGGGRGAGEMSHYYPVGRHQGVEEEGFDRRRGGGGGCARGRGCTQFVHVRSSMTKDPRIPTMPGRSTSSFHQPGRHCACIKREAP